MKMIVINKDTAEKQYILFKNTNDHVADIGRFSAVNGTGADRNELIAKGIIEAGKEYTDVAIGHALSHMSLWSSIVEYNAAALIMEDNACLSRNFTEQSSAILSSLNDSWDIVFFGYDLAASTVINVLPGVSPCALQFDHDLMRKAAYTWRGRYVASHPYRLLQAKGTFCYAISPKGAAQLLKACLPLPPTAQSQHPQAQNLSLENAMAGIYPQLNAFAAFPPIAITGNESSLLAHDEKQHVHSVSL